MTQAILYVCATCRRSGGLDPNTPDLSGPDLDALRPGAKMLAALQGLEIPENLELRAVECLSACSHGCAVALSAPGKWSYVYGDLDPETHAPAILQGAALYADSVDGLTPWRARPDIFKKQSRARIPPIFTPTLSVAEKP